MNKLVYPVLSTNNRNNCFTAKEKSNAFLDHFNSVYINSSEVELEPCASSDVLFDHSLIFITDFMVYEEMNKLLPKINPSPDGIPQILLKNVHYPYQNLSLIYFN